MASYIRAWTREGKIVRQIKIQIDRFPFVSKETKHIDERKN